MTQLRITKEYLKQFLPAAPIILEAGAHNGRDTLKLHATWPASTIYAFEPVPVLFTELQQRVANIPAIHCYNLALSDNNGTAPFHVSSGRITAASSLFKPTGYWQEHPETTFTEIQMPTQTLDSWATEQSVTKMDFMWLDMQGAELAVLKAAPRILATTSVILAEANLTERYANAPLYNELRMFLENNGFAVEREDFFKTTWGNVLFVRRPH
jgi:FkbM family methyltransferase